MSGSIFDRSYWHIHAKSKLPEAFCTMEQAYALDGEIIESNPNGKVIRHENDGDGFYIKKLSRGCKSRLRQYLVRSRIRSEAKNQLYLESIGIPIAPLIAWGEMYRGTRLLKGVFISREICNSRDLRKIANQQPELFRYGPWLNSISTQVATVTRKMHDQHFCHNDLKWRNILIVDNQPDPGIYLIDCPSGRFWFEPFLSRRICKDLACLNKNAVRFNMTRTRRLAFYMQYANIKRLTPAHKKQVRHVLNYFS